MSAIHSLEQVHFTLSTSNPSAFMLRDSFINIHNYVVDLHIIYDICLSDLLLQLLQFLKYQKGYILEELDTPSDNYSAMILCFKLVNYLNNAESSLHKNKSDLNYLLLVCE